MIPWLAKLRFQSTSVTRWRNLWTTPPVCIVETAGFNSWQLTILILTVWHQHTHRIAPFRPQSPQQTRSSRAFDAWTYSWRSHFLRRVVTLRCGKSTDVRHNNNWKLKFDTVPELKHLSWRSVRVLIVLDKDDQTADLLVDFCLAVRSSSKVSLFNENRSRLSTGLIENLHNCISWEELEKIINLHFTMSFFGSGPPITRPGRLPHLFGKFHNLEICNFNMPDENQDIFLYSVGRVRQRGIFKWVASFQLPFPFYGSSRNILYPCIRHPHPRTLCRW